MEENNSNTETKMNGAFDGTNYSIDSDGYITVTEGDISVCLSGSKFVSGHIAAMRRAGVSISAWTADRIHYVFCLAERRAQVA
jgi:hypothetical protein